MVSCCGRNGQRGLGGFVLFVIVVLDSLRDSGVSIRMAAQLLQVQNLL